MKKYFIYTLLLVSIGVSPSFAVDYNPSIHASDFSTNIDNPYFTLPIGKKIFYSDDTNNGTIKKQVFVSGVTTEIIGVNTLVYWEREFDNGVMIKDTRNYLAQDDNGNVWNFGADVNNYKNNVFLNHNGSWLSGIKDALPGMWFPATPREDDTFRSEYLEGEQEGFIDIVATNQTMNVQGMTYNNCVKTYQHSSIDSTLKSYKYYCKNIASLVKEENLSNNDVLTFTSSTTRKKFSYSPTSNDNNIISDYKYKLAIIGERVPKKLEPIAVKIEKAIPSIEGFPRVGFIVSEVLVDTYGEMYNYFDNQRVYQEGVNCTFREPTGGIMESAVPSEVKDALIRDYRTANANQWYRVDGNYKVIFTERLIKNTIVYSSTGILLSAEVQTAFDKLPLKVRLAALEKYDLVKIFNGAVIVDKVTFKTTYKVKVNLGDIGFDLIFDSNGNLLEKITNQANTCK